MSLCDACRVPGHCCFGISVSGEWGETALEALIKMASAYGAAPDRGPAAAELGLPFIPLIKFGVRWLFWCANLRGDGRCGDYANRPYACRSYLAGTDRICVESPDRLAIGIECAKEMQNA